MRTFLGVCVAALVGVALAAVPPATLNGTAPCARTACDLDYDYCSSTDLAVECAQGRPCQTRACESQTWDEKLFALLERVYL